MRNKKGFTLIELLAVIVILAIIALIATPIVLGIIDDSKQNTRKVTAQYIVDSVEKAYSMAYTSNNGKEAGALPNITQVMSHFDMKGAYAYDVKGASTAKYTTTINDQETEVSYDYIISTRSFSTEDMEELEDIVSEAKKADVYCYVASFENDLIVNCKDSVPSSKTSTMEIATGN